MVSPKSLNPKALKMRGSSDFPVFGSVFRVSGLLVKLRVEGFRGLGSRGLGMKGLGYNGLGV